MASSPHSMFRAGARAPARVLLAGALLRMEPSWESSLTRTFVSHGFLLDKHGAVTTFDAPDAGTGFNQGTLPLGINTNGAITGWYVDSANVNHGFVRDKHGAIVEFDVPGAGTGPFQGPNVYSIAPNGAVTGFYFDANNVVHGFVREADRAVGLGQI